MLYVGAIGHNKQGKKKPFSYLMDLVLFEGNMHSHAKASPLCPRKEGWAGGGLCELGRWCGILIGWLG